MYRRICRPGSNLSRCKPRSIIAFHDHGVIGCDICKASVKCSLLVSETRQKGEFSIGQIFEWQCHKYALDGPAENENVRAPSFNHYNATYCVGSPWLKKDHRLHKPAFESVSETVNVSWHPLEKTLTLVRILNQPQELRAIGPNLEIIAALSFDNVRTRFPGNQRGQTRWYATCEARESCCLQCCNRHQNNQGERKVAVHCCRAKLSNGNQKMMNPSLAASWLNTKTEHIQRCFSHHDQNTFPGTMKVEPDYILCRRFVHVCQNRKYGEILLAVNSKRLRTWQPHGMNAESLVVNCNLFIW